MNDKLSEVKMDSPHGPKVDEILEGTPSPSHTHHFLYHKWPSRTAVCPFWEIIRFFSNGAAS